MVEHPMSLRGLRHRVRRTRRAAAAVRLAVAHAASVACLPLAAIGAQPTPIAECTTPCPLVLEVVGTFGDDEGPGIIEGFTQAFTDDSGRKYLISGSFTEVKVYDSGGHFLHRIGRKGEGPGEFPFISSLQPIGDSLVAVLDRTGRLQFFDPTGRLLRQVRLPFLPTGTDMVYAAGLGLVIAADVPTPERAGLPLHLVDVDDGSVVRSFGSLSGEYRLGEVGRRQRVLAVGPTGAVWAARVSEYRIELWTPDGLRRSMVRDAPWFPPVTPATASHGWFERPNTFIGSMAATDSELWVTFNVADERWDERRRLREASESRNYDLFYDTVIEVIDLAELRVVGRVRLDEEYGNLIAPGIIGRTVVTPEASARHVLYRISTGTG